MSSLRFVVTWDYRGRFARNLCDHVLVGLASGADWDVDWRAFSVEQTRRGEGRPSIWEEPGDSVSVLAMQVGLAVRDLLPERFPAVHAALFAARHDEGADLRDAAVLRRVLRAHDVDAGPVLAEVATGRPLSTYRAEHEALVAEHGVFGVPTLVAGGRAAFARLLRPSGGDPEVARRTVERLLGLVVAWPELNELKHTAIPRPPS